MLRVCFSSLNHVVKFQEVNGLCVEASMIACCVIAIKDLTPVLLPISLKVHFSNLHLCISYPFLSCLVIALI